MRWNCPHCGTTLAIGDDKIGTGWAFSRCYKCAGHAMVRRPEVNLIKVDRAPAGEQVLLPEGFEENFMTAKSAENLQKRGVRSSVFADFERTRAGSQLGAEMDRSAHSHAPAQRTPTRIPERPANYASPGRQVPLTDGAMAAGPQLPASHSLSLGKHPGFDEPAEIPAAAKSAHSPHAHSLKKTATPLATETKGSLPEAFPDFPEPLPDVPAPSSNHRLLPVAFGLAGAVAVASGAYLYVQAQSILHRPSSASADRRIQRTSLERPVQQTQSPSMPQAQAPQQQSEEASHEIAITQSAAAPIMAPISEPAHNEITPPDRRPAIQRDAPAEAKETNRSEQAQPAQGTNANPPLMVKPKGKNVSLYKGPGPNFPTVGLANESAKYVVTDWNDRWFKVMIAARGPGEGNDYAWIRTDTVKVLINAQ